jgi:molecular chaperone DnaK
LIERNTTIPVTKRELFTTSVDNQPFVPIHVLQGEREMSADNKTLAKFELSPIPPAPRGVPQIEVTFAVDAEAIVHVSAKDLGTGKEQKITVTASSGLSRDQVDRMVTEANQYRESDSKRKELAELKNSAAALLYTSERAVEECASMVDPEITAAVRANIAQLKKFLEGAGDAIAIRDALQQLELSAYRIADAVYNAESSGADAAKDPSPEGNKRGL